MADDVAALVDERLAELGDSEALAAPLDLPAVTEALADLDPGAALEARLGGAPGIPWRLGSLARRDHAQGAPGWGRREHGGEHIEESARRRFAERRRQRGRSERAVALCRAEAPRAETARRAGRGRARCRRTPPRRVTRPACRGSLGPCFLRAR